MAKKKTKPATLASKMKEAPEHDISGGSDFTPGVVGLFTLTHEYTVKIDDVIDKELYPAGAEVRELEDGGMLFTFKDVEKANEAAKELGKWKNHNLRIHAPTEKCLNLSKPEKWEFGYGSSVPVKSRRTKSWEWGCRWLIFQGSAYRATIEAYPEEFEGVDASVFDLQPLLDVEQEIRRNGGDSDEWDNHYEALVGSPETWQESALGSGVDLIEKNLVAVNPKLKKLAQYYLTHNAEEWMRVQFVPVPFGNAIRNGKHQSIPVILKIYPDEEAARADAEATGGAIIPEEWRDMPEEWNDVILPKIRETFKGVALDDIPEDTLEEDYLIKPSELEPFWN